MFFRKKNPQRSYDLAFSYYNQKQYNSALEQIIGLIKKEPNNHDYIILCANILEDGISKEKALEQYKRAWEIEKHYSTAFRIGYCSMIVNSNPRNSAMWCYTALELFKKQEGEKRPLMSVSVNSILYNIGFYLIHIKDEYTIGYAMEFIKKAALVGHPKAELLYNAISQGDFNTIKFNFPTIFEAFDTNAFTEYKIPMGGSLKSFI